jgi:hypothetical protein
MSRHPRILLHHSENGKARYGLAVSQPVAPSGRGGGVVSGRYVRDVASADGAILLGGAVLVWLLYLSSLHGAPGNSDGATVILEGRSMSGGNVLLSHWALSLDSFWLVDVLPYAVATGIAGLHPQLLHLVPAIIATAVILVGAWTARDGSTRWAGAAAAGFVVVTLGLPTHALAEFLIMGPLHVCTALWCLVAFVALRRSRLGWGWVAALLLLAAGLLGDLQTLALGIGPVAAAGIAAVLRHRKLVAGVPALSAAAGAIALAEVVRAIARAIGSFSIGPTNPRAPFHQMAANVGHVFTYGASLEGVGYHPFGAEVVPTGLVVLHAIGLLVIVAGVLFALSRLVLGCITGRPGSGGATSEGFLDDALLFGFLGGCAVFVWLSVSSSGAYGRYLTAAAIFGSILGGRLLGKAWTRAAAHHLATANRARRTSMTTAAIAVAAATTAGYAVTFASTLSVAPPTQTAVQLTRWLSSHHLTHGIGDYWSASIVTVESAGNVVVRPVIATGGPHITRYLRQSSSTWYGGRFEFLVYNAASPWGGVDAASAATSFGVPAHTYDVGGYRVLVWNRGLQIRPDGTFAAPPHSLENSARAVASTSAASARLRIANVTFSMLPVNANGGT